MQGFRKPPLPDEILADAFDRALNEGISFSKLAAEYRKDKATFNRELLRYRPYVKWLNDRRQDPSLRYIDLRSMLTKGFNIRHIAELFDMSYDDTVAEIRKLEAADGRTYLSDDSDSEYKHFITVYDVERFREKVNVGELLVYDRTDDGVMLFCKVLKKHRYFATTDVGTVQWNWLCVKNERRLYFDEIIWG